MNQFDLIVFEDHLEKLLKKKIFFYKKKKIILLRVLA
jgi:hypothetical protein